MMHIGECYAQAKSIPECFIILDSASSESVFMNKKFVSAVTDVASASRSKIITNGGDHIFPQMGCLKFFTLQVWFDASSLANVIALYDIASLPAFRVTMDSEKSKALVVYMPNGNDIVFKECGLGLYDLDTRYLTTNDIYSKNTITEYSSHSFLSTVQENKANFPRQQILQADKAHKLQQFMGWPSTQDFKKYVASSALYNSNVTVDDIARADYIDGPSVPMLQGKSTRSIPRGYTPPTLVPLPPPILEHHR